MHKADFHTSTKGEWEQPGHAGFMTAIKHHISVPRVTRLIVHLFISPWLALCAAVTCLSPPGRQTHAQVSSDRNGVARRSGQNKWLLIFLALSGWVGFPQGSHAVENVVLKLLEKPKALAVSQQRRISLKFSVRLESVRKVCGRGSKNHRAVILELGVRFI